MSKYTVKGSPELDSLIDAHMERIAEAVKSSACADNYTAIVLLGGYGRGEGTPHIAGDGEQGKSGSLQRPFNDYDLVVVVERMDSAVRRDLKKLEVELSEELGLPVDLYPYLRSDLPKCEFSLLNFELRYGHIVIWGPSDILDEMPDYRKEDIPLSEGTRLLINRGKLLLDIRTRLSEGSSLSAEEHLRFIKFLFKASLAMGDCALLIDGDYDIGYSRKRETIAQMKAEDLDELETVTGDYRRAIEFKEWGDFGRLADMDIAAEFMRISELFTDFFHWYEGRRLNGDCSDPAAYARLLFQRGNECSWIKALAYNFLWLRGRVFHASCCQLLSHPRLRMYAAMPLLLAGNPVAERIARRLALRNADFETCAHEFYAMQGRYS